MGLAVDSQKVVEKHEVKVPISAPHAQLPNTDRCDSYRDTGRRYKPLPMSLERTLQEFSSWSRYAMVQRYAHLSAKHLAAYADNAARSRALNSAFSVTDM